MDLDRIKSELKERVAKGLNFGIEGVEEMIDQSAGLYNDFVLLKSKYNDLMYISSINTLPYEQLEIGLDRLRSALIGIIDRLDHAGLKKKEINPDLKIQALPARRANFFKLLDIHFRNLEAVNFIEIYGDEENRKTGREAIFEIYQMNRRKFRNREDLEGEKGFEILRAHFSDYFSNEKGVLEVYFKNIKNLLSYALENEVDRQFFLNTLRSLLSRFEMGLSFYYVASGVDPDFEDLVIRSSLIDDSIGQILIVRDHAEYLK